jgi:DNA-binding winged helix-turn-helix (wHTH) protein/tetratricopeptide (TPR) repeat protein
MLLNTATGREPDGDIAHRTFSFDEFVLDADRGALLKEGEDVPLRPKSFEVLSYLVSHHGRLVSKDELLKAVWADVVVTGDSLTQCLIEIRKALADKSKNIVRTVPRRGYLLDVPVTVHEPAGNPEKNSASGLFFSNRRPSVWSMGAALVLAVAIAGIGWNGAQNSQPPQGIQDPAHASSPISVAMQHNLRGRFFHNRRAPGDLERALAQYHQALDADPGLADAWIGMAGTLLVQAYESDGFISEDVLTSYKSALDRALELEPENGEAHARLSRYYKNIHEPGLAQEHLEIALERGWNNPLVLSIAAGTAFSQSLFNEAIVLQRRAASLDPLGFVNRGNLAGMLYSAGRLDEAELEFNKALDLNPALTASVNESLMGIHILRRQFDEADSLAQQLPDSLARDRGMALVHHAQGHQAESASILERLSANPEIEAATVLAEIYANLQMPDKSFHWLNLATERRFIAEEAHQGSNFLSDMRNSPFLRPLHGDPRWAVWLESTENRIAEHYSPESGLTGLDPPYPHPVVGMKLKLH